MKSRLKRLFFLWALALAAGFAYADFGSSDQESTLLIQGFLRSQNIVRVGFETGPGLGHQSTAVSVARGLRRLGYEGWIEIVYNSSPKPKAETDLALLFPEFDCKGEELQENSIARLRFISTRHFKAHPLQYPETGLGILGADDHHRKPADLRVRALLTLQPMGWYEQSKLQVLYPLTEPEIALDRLSGMGFVHDTKAADDVNETDFSKEGLGNHKDFELKLNHLKMLLAMSEAVDLAPYYGHGYYSSTTQLETYLRAIRLGQVVAPESFSAGVVVPLFIDSPWYDNQTTHDLQKNAELAGHVKTMAIDDPLFPQALRALRAGEILVLYTGRVPKDVFELFFTKAAIAPVVGGRNSQNFMRQIVRPYLTSSPRVRFEFSQDTPYKRAQASALLAERAMLSEKRVDAADIEVLARFLAEAKQPKSDIYKMFTESSLSKGINQDKLAQGLLETMRRWDQVGMNARQAMAAYAIRSSKERLNNLTRSCAQLLRGI